MSYTWDPSNKNANITLSNGNLTATNIAPATQWEPAASTPPNKTSGKYYWRVKGNIVVGGSFATNCLTNGTLPTGDNYIGIDNNGWIAYAQVGVTGNVQHNSVVIGATPVFIASGDYIVAAYDANNGSIYFTTMTAAGILSTNWNNTNANPATNTGGFSVTPGTGLRPGISLVNPADNGILDTTTVISSSSLSGFVPLDGVISGITALDPKHYIITSDLNPMPSGDLQTLLTAMQNYNTPSEL